MGNKYIHALHTWMLGDCSIEQMIDWIGKIGFSADLSISASGSFSPDRIISRSTSYWKNCGIDIPVCTTMYMSKDLNLSDSDSDVRKKAIDFSIQCISAAACIGADRLLVSPSYVMDGATLSQSRQADLSRAEESIREIGLYAASQGIKLMIEPINRYRVALIHTVSEAMTLADAVGLDNIGVVPDTFHMCMEETKSIPQVIAEAAERLLCLHIGGNTRNVPGMDTFDWSAVLTALRENNYTGVLSYEPVKLYFDAMKVSCDRECRELFMHELQRGKDYLENLSV